jgi:hypothetical protein
VDAIYIDPPYNTGAKDWKYNNDYVEGDDLYRHSKWLAMMERRLLLAKELLDPTDSVLVVSIDEKEYLRLGLLLDQIFPDATIEMVTSVISAKGVARIGQFSRVEECSSTLSESALQQFSSASKTCWTTPAPRRPRLDATLTGLASDAVNQQRAVAHDLISSTRSS